MDTEPRSRRSPFERAAALLLILAAACAGEEAARPVETKPPANPDPAHLAITATDFDFALPPSVPAGPYEFTLVNRGEQTHNAQLYRLAEGVSFEEFREVLLSNPEFTLQLPEEVLDLVVGAPTGVLTFVSPDAEGTGRGELERGVYAAVCSLPDIEPGTGKASGKAHHALGMVAEVQVGER